MANFLNLDLSALSGHVPAHTVKAFQQACEAAGQLPNQLASDASWTDRYRLNAFAQANGLHYDFQVDPNILPGREHHRQYYAAFTINDVLTSPTQPRVMLANLSDPYTSSGRTTGSPGSVELIGISTPHMGKSAYFEARPWKENAAADLLEERFMISGDRASYEQFRKRIPNELVAAVLDIAHGWDFGFAGQWFYIQRQPWRVKVADPKRISEHFAMAVRLMPYVELMTDPKSPAPALPETAQRPPTAEAQDDEIDRKARAFVESLKQQPWDSGPEELHH